MFQELAGWFRCYIGAKKYAYRLVTQKRLTLILTCASRKLELRARPFGGEVLNIIQAVAEEEWRWLF